MQGDKWTVYIQLAPGLGIEEWITPRLETPTPWQNNLKPIMCEECNSPGDLAYWMKVGIGKDRLLCTSHLHARRARLDTTGLWVDKSADIQMLAARTLDKAHRLLLSSMGQSGFKGV